MELRRDVFQAIADPTRREILNMIAHEALNVNAVSGNFDVSRAAIYKHVKILTECGLIVIKQQGRERFCEARLEKLDEVSQWVEQYRRVWTARLDSLEKYLGELQSKKRTKHPKQKRYGNTGCRNNYSCIANNRIKSGRHGYMAHFIQKKSYTAK